MGKGKGFLKAFGLEAHCILGVQWLKDHLFGKEVFFLLTVIVFRERFISLCVCVCVCASLPFGFEGGI